MSAFLASLESKGALIGLAGIVIAAILLELTGHLSPGMVSVLEWAGSSFMAAQGACHIGRGMGQ